MKIKNLYLIIIFLITPWLGWAQSIDDLLEKESQNANDDGITMMVDRDIPKGGAKGEKEKQDSISQINDKWKKYLLGKNDEVKQINNALQEINPKKIKKEEVDNFILQVNYLKKDFENRKETNGLWKGNDELDELRNEFDFNCDKLLTELNQLKETAKSKTPPNKLIVIGIGLLSLMVLVPIITQIKSTVTVKKAKKIQDKLTKTQREEAEMQRLLADDKNIISLNN